MKRGAGFVMAGALLLLPSAVPAQVPPAPAVTVDGHQLVLPRPVVFRAETARLADAATLAPVKAYLDSKTYITALRIEGHVRDGGASAQRLSEERAMAVARALVAQGVDCKRLIVTGFGNTKPVAAPGQSANERITFVNAALRGRPIGGLPTDGGGRIAGNACAN